MPSRIKPASALAALCLFSALVSPCAETSPSVEAVNIVCPESAQCEARRPGLQLRVTLSKPVDADTPVHLYVDNTVTDVAATIPKGSKEVRFPLPAKPKDATADLFLSVRTRPVSIGLKAGPAWESKHTLTFEPAGVVRYSVLRRGLAARPCENNSTVEECRPRLGDEVILWTHPEALASYKDTDKLLMWIDGQPVPGLVAFRGTMHNGQLPLHFQWSQSLPSKPDSKDAWLRILRRPWEDRLFTFTAGPAAGPALPSKLDKVLIRRFSLKGAWAFAGFVLIIVLLLGYAIPKGLLRESGPGEVKTKAYSLARTQMVVWTVLVASALSFIWLVTWNEDVIPVNVLALMGITFGTTLSAVTVDKSKNEAAAAAGNPLPTPATEWFLLDLISDSDGPAVSRVQMLIFTLILMVIFFWETLQTLAMPEFSTTLIGLMGASSAAYVSFKIPEKK